MSKGTAHICINVFYRAKFGKIVQDGVVYWIPPSLAPQKSTSRDRITQSLGIETGIRRQRIAFSLEAMGLWKEDRNAAMTKF